MKSAARILGVTAIAVLFGLLIVGCGGQKTVTPIAVGEMQEYRDPLYGFRIQFPKGWKNQSESGKMRIYSSGRNCSAIRRSDGCISRRCHDRNRRDQDNSA